MRFVWEQGAKGGSCTQPGLIPLGFDPVCVLASTHKVHNYRQISEGATEGRDFYVRTVNRKQEKLSHVRVKGSGLLLRYECADYYLYNVLVGTYCIPPTRVAGVFPGSRYRRCSCYVAGTGKYRAGLGTNHCYCDLLL